MNAPAALIAGVASRVFVPAFVIFSEKDFRRGSELTRLPPSTASNDQLRRLKLLFSGTAKTHKEASPRGALAHCA